MFQFNCLSHLGATLRKHERGEGSGIPFPLPVRLGSMVRYEHHKILFAAYAYWGLKLLHYIVNVFQCQIEN